jgi:cell division protein FtsQ
MLQDRPGRWKLLLRRQRRKLRPALAGLLLLLVLLVGAGLVRMLGRGADFGERFADAAAGLGLRVQNVVVSGEHKTPDVLVQAALGVHRGDPILGFSVAGARDRLETINWVRSAVVERQLPGTISVQLTERRPYAVWQHDGKFVLVDEKGNMVTDSDVAAFADQLPLIVGAGAPQAAARLLDALAARPDLQARMAAAVRVGGRRWDLHMKSGTDVELPEAAEAQALTRLEQLQTSHALLDRPLRVIDMRLPDRLVLRPYPAAVAGKPGDRPNAKPGDAANSGRKPT